MSHLRFTYNINCDNVVRVYHQYVMNNDMKTPEGIIRNKKLASLFYNPPNLSKDVDIMKTVPEEL